MRPRLIPRPRHSTRFAVAAQSRSSVLVGAAQTWQRAPRYWLSSVLYRSTSFLSLTASFLPALAASTLRLRALSVERVELLPDRAAALSRRQRCRARIAAEAVAVRASGERGDGSSSRQTHDRPRHRAGHRCPLLSLHVPLALTKHNAAVFSTVQNGTVTRLQQRKYASSSDPPCDPRLNARAQAAVATTTIGRAAHASHCPSHDVHAGALWRAANSADAPSLRRRSPPSAPASQLAQQRRWRKRSSRSRLRHDGRAPVLEVGVGLVELIGFVQICLRHLVFLDRRLLDLFGDTLLAQDLDARGERHAGRIDLRLRRRCLGAQRASREEVLHAALAGTSCQRYAGEYQRRCRDAINERHEQHPRIVLVAVARTPRAYILLLLADSYSRFPAPASFAQALRRNFCSIER